MEVVRPLGCTPLYENTKHNLECNEWRLRFMEGEITRITRTAECSTVEQQQGENIDCHRWDIKAKVVVYGEIKKKYLQARRTGQQLQERQEAPDAESEKSRDAPNGQHQKLGDGYEKAGEYGVNRVADKMHRNEAMLAALNGKRTDLAAITPSGTWI
ncbi:hypothetical protein quinque_014383 [Culex quinquefasciatus]